MNQMKEHLCYILARNIFRRDGSKLPNTFEVSHPKMEYHALADAIFWEDECLRDCLPDLENVFRKVIHYRTALITGEATKESQNYFEPTKQYFPCWISFDESSFGSPLVIIEGIFNPSDSSSFIGVCPS